MSRGKAVFKVSWFLHSEGVRVVSLGIVGDKSRR